MPAASAQGSLSDIVEAYKKSLDADGIQATGDLERCGQHVLKVLHRATQALTAANTALETAIAQVKTLLALADDHINSIDFSKVAQHWLQLHTDTSLLLGLLSLCQLSRLTAGPSSRKAYLQIIHRLDKAIIISGAIGEHRSEWIQACIRLAQGQLPNLSPPRDHETGRPSKRKRVEPSKGEFDSIFSQKRIPEASSIPTMEEYRSRACRHPLILRGALLSNEGPCPPWRAFNKWSSAEYLLELVGDGRVVPVEIGSAYDDTGWTQAIVPFRSFLRRAGFNVQVDQDEDELIPAQPDGPWYLAQYEICRQFPGLEADFTLPDYVWSEPDLGVGTSSSRLVNPAVNIWFGPGGGQVNTPAHTDPHFNCFAQVLGRKRVWIVLPDCSPYMSVHGKTLDDPSIASEYMTNTSTVPIFRQRATAALLESEYPSFCQHVRPKAMEAYLDPGDLLLLPSGWWHAMQGVGEGPGCSISIWF